MIEIRNLRFSYGKSLVLDDCSGQITAGEMVALLGSNGSGKSTLLNCLMGWVEPNSGQIIIKNEALKNMSTPLRSSSMAIVLSRIASLPMMTVRETLQVGIALQKNGTSRIEHWMEVCGINNFSDRLLNTLSDGQLQRTMIARALIQETPILLMDEPLAHLDHLSKIELMGLMNDLKKAGKTILFSTHDIHYINQEVDKIWFLQNKSLSTLLGSSDLNNINWEL